MRGIVSLFFYKSDSPAVDGQAWKLIISSMSFTIPALFRYRLFSVSDAFRCRSSCAVFFQPGSDYERRALELHGSSLFISLAARKWWTGLMQVFERFGRSRCGIEDRIWERVAGSLFRVFMPELRKGHAFANLEDLRYASRTFLFWIGTDLRSCCPQ